MCMCGGKRDRNGKAQRPVALCGVASVLLSPLNKNKQAGCRVRNGNRKSSFLDLDTLTDVREGEQSFEVLFSLPRIPFTIK